MQVKEEIISKRQLRKRTVIAFTVFIFMIFISVFIWKWIHKQPLAKGTPKLIRNVLNYNESFFSSVYSNQKLTKTYPVSKAAKKVRVNGKDGMSAVFDPTTWKLKVARSAGDTLLISIDEIRALPKTEIVFDFKCIEEWSQVSHWGGVKFSDFAKKYNLTEEVQKIMLD